MERVQRQLPVKPLSLSSLRFVATLLFSLISFMATTVSPRLLARLHSSSTSGTTWLHSWLQLTLPLQIPCTSTVPSIKQPPRPTWLLHVTLPLHGQPALPRPQHLAFTQCSCKKPSHIQSIPPRPRPPAFTWHPRKSIAPALSQHWTLNRKYALPFSFSF